MATRDHFTRYGNIQTFDPTHVWYLGDDGIDVSLYRVKIDGTGNTKITTNITATVRSAVVSSHLRGRVIYRDTITEPSDGWNWANSYDGTNSTQITIVSDNIWHADYSSFNNALYWQVRNTPLVKKLDLVNFRLSTFVDVSTLTLSFIEGNPEGISTVGGEIVIGYGTGFIRIDLDGNVLAEKAVTNARRPVLDPFNKVVYYNGTNEIAKIDYNFIGSSTQLFVHTNNIESMKPDWYNRKIYLTNSNVRSVEWVNMDGTGIVNTIISTGLIFIGPLTLVRAR